MTAAASLASSAELEGEEEEAYDYFLSCLNGTMEEEPCKLRFVASIRTLCRAWSQGRYQPEYETVDNMVEKIQALWQEEPLLSTGDVMRKQAILAITALSEHHYVYHHLSPCITSTFSLHSQAMGGQEAELTAQIQQTLDSLLQMTLCVAYPETTLLTVEIILKALLPFLTSPEVDMRRRAVSTLVSLSRVLKPPEILKAMRDSQYFFFSTEEHLEVLGQMMAHFTLCCTEEDQEISSVAVEGLHIWLRFLLLRQSSNVVCMNPVLPVEMGRFCTFSPKEVNDDDSMTFGCYLLPAERTKFLLTVLWNIAHPRVSDVRPLANMIEAVLRDPCMARSEVREIVKAICEQMTAISHNLLLEDILRKTLLRLVDLEPQNVTTALLELSPQCNSSARALWRMLGSEPRSAEYTLKEMLQIQNYKMKILGTGHCVNILSIGLAMQEIFQVPSNYACLHYFFGELFMAVAQQISHSLKCKQDCCCFCAMPKENRVSLVRSMVSTMQILFCAMGGPSLVEDMWTQDAWPMLMSLDTFHTGISTLTRALRSQGMDLCHSMFEQALTHLCHKQKYQDMGVMAVFVELLDFIGCEPTDRHILKVLKVQLQSENLLLRRMMLSSLVRLSRRPKQQAAVLGVLLTELMQQLRVDDCDIRMAVLTILSNELCLVDRETALRVALQLPEMLLPLFENESSCVRERSILLYRDAVRIAVSTHRKQMEMAVRRSLMPLFFHLHDQEQSVAQASQEVLLEVTKLLKYKQLRRLLKTKKERRIVECLLKDSSGLGEYVEQSLRYLRSSQEQLRERAVRFLGLASRQLSAGQQETVLTIYKALEDMQTDCCPAVSSLVAEILRTQRGRRRRRFPFSLFRGREDVVVWP